MDTALPLSITYFQFHLFYSCFIYCLNISSFLALSLLFMYNFLFLSTLSDTEVFLLAVVGLMSFWSVPAQYRTYVT
jgi:hypothetical protein